MASYSTSGLRYPGSQGRGTTAAFCIRGEVGRKGNSILARVDRGLRALAAGFEEAKRAGVDALALPKADLVEWVQAFRLSSGE